MFYLKLTSYRQYFFLFWCCFLLDYWISNLNHRLDFLNKTVLIFQDKQEKHFIFRHSRTVFDLLDQDGSNNISADEFQHFGFLFNFEGAAVKGIFNEFDVSGDQVCVY